MMSCSFTLASRIVPLESIGILVSPLVEYHSGTPLRKMQPKL